MTERNLYRLVAVSFGLICILQTAFNIFQHLSLYKTNLKLEAQLENATEWQERLTFAHYDCRNLVGIHEMIMVNFSNEQGELIRKLMDSDWNIRELANVTKERDELKGKLTQFVIELMFDNKWKYYNQSLYYISSTQKTWYESKSDCLQRGADLMIINSEEEQALTRQWKDNMWIGLTDRDTEGTWKWVDETSLKTSYWMSNEPNGFDHKEEDCVEVRNHVMRNSWNDESCNSQRFWVCEKKLFR